jgi:chorismate mutase
MAIRGIRGATTLASDTPHDVLSATTEMLEAILQANPHLQPAEIASVFFTVTEDILSAYPALAARQMGWHLVPMICAREIPVAGGLPLCVRALIHWNTDMTQDQIRHVYLRDAIQLRPEWAAGLKEKSG